MKLIIIVSNWELRIVTVDLIGVVAVEHNAPCGLAGAQRLLLSVIMLLPLCSLNEIMLPRYKGFGRKESSWWGRRGKQVRGAPTYTR